MTKATMTAFVRASAAALGILAATYGYAGGPTVTWSVGATPSTGGSIDYSITSPASGGSITKPKKLVFDEGAFVDLTFRANPGWELRSVLKNGTEWLPFLDESGHFRFGPVDNPHLIRAVFVPLVPTGDFDLVAPNIDSVPQIMDLTGSYAGVSPTLHQRDYAFDVAMDDEGRLTAMGTVEGVVPEGGGEIAGSVGRVRTVNGEPVIESKGTFRGTRDGIDVSGKAAFAGPAALQTVGADPYVAQGTLSYDARAGGVPVKDTNVPVQATVDAANRANLRRAWNVRLEITEHAGTKSPSWLGAKATLTLPNGDVIVFAEKRTKYSPKKGYFLTFTKGTNTSVVPPVKDRRTSLRMTALTFEQSGESWHPTGGQMSYAFLGQKGSARLTEFLRVKR